MFKHILVPLDGSELAEAALPAARFLAAALAARVTLLHVIEADAPPTIHGERHLHTPDEAEAYLKGICEQGCPEGGGIDWHVHAAATSNVVESIIEHQDELAPDLVILCTHGRSGLKRLLVGSIAQQVVAAGRTPVLLIRPQERRGATTFGIKTVLAPLDGDPAHEPGFETAAELARSVGAGVHLISVIPTIATLAGHDATMVKFMPGTTQAILQLAEDDLEAYLREHVARLQRNGVTASAELRRGDSAPVIAAAADAGEASLVVLATHGKAGSEAFWTNSVAAKVMGLTMRPLLLAPVR